MTVEKLGVPTVPIITNTFESPVLTAVSAKGMANLRFAFILHPVAYRPAEECREKILGNDPITGRQVLSEIVEGLTTANRGRKEYRTFRKTAGKATKA